MNIGTAIAIFENLDDCQESIETKGLAVRIVLDMETHNSITKKQLLKAMEWLWSQSFELLRKEGEQE